MTLRADQPLTHGRSVGDLQYFDPQTVLQRMRA